MPQQNPFADLGGKPVDADNPFADIGGKPVPEGPGMLKRAGQLAYEYLVPSPRGAFRMGGAALGGTIGAPSGAGLAIGGALGAAGGEGLYQIIQGLRGAPGTPRTSAESLAGAGEAAGLGALQEFGGPYISKGISKAAESSIAKTVQRILKPATDAMKEAMESTSLELSQRMPVALTRKRLLAKIEPQVGSLRQAVDGAYAYIRAKAPNLRISSVPIRQVIQNARDAEFVKGKVITGSEPLVQQYDDLLEFLSKKVPGPPVSKQVPTGLLDPSGKPIMRTVQAPTTTTGPEDLTMDEFRKVKAGWDRAINYARSSLAKDPIREAAFRDGADAIRALQHQISPELAIADHQFSIWKDALDSLTKYVRGEVGREPRFDIGRFLGHTGVTGGLGYALGGVTGLELAGGAEVAGTIAQKIYQSTAWRTAIDMPTKKLIVNLLNRGKVQEAVGLFLSQAGQGALQPGETVSLSPAPQ
jgi:hypothetical protein